MHNPTSNTGHFHPRCTEEPWCTVNEPSEHAEFHAGDIAHHEPGNGDDLPMVDRRAQAATVARRLGFLVMPKGTDPARQHDISVPVEGGSIRVRIYRPEGSGPFPLYVFLHGGGWCVGTVDERDPVLLGLLVRRAVLPYDTLPGDVVALPPPDDLRVVEPSVQHGQVVVGEPTERHVHRG